jgi:hypothetical protein
VRDLNLLYICTTGKVLGGRRVCFGLWLSWCEAIRSMAKRTMVSLESVRRSYSRSSRCQSPSRFAPRSVRLVLHAAGPGAVRRNKTGTHIILYDKAWALVVVRSPPSEVTASENRGFRREQVSPNLVRQTFDELCAWESAGAERDAQTSNCISLYAFYMQTAWTSLLKVFCKNAQPQSIGIDRPDHGKPNRQGSARLPLRKA